MALSASHRTENIQATNLPPISDRALPSASRDQELTSARDTPRSQFAIARSGGSATALLAGLQNRLAPEPPDTSANSRGGGGTTLVESGKYGALVDTTKSGSRDTTSAPHGATELMRDRTPKLSPQQLQQRLDSCMQENQKETDKIKAALEIDLENVKDPEEAQKLAITAYLKIIDSMRDTFDRSGEKDLAQLATRILKSKSIEQLEDRQKLFFTALAERGYVIDTLGSLNGGPMFQKVIQRELVGTNSSDGIRQLFSKQFNPSKDQITVYHFNGNHGMGLGGYAGFTAAGIGLPTIDPHYSKMIVDMMSNNCPSDFDRSNMPAAFSNNEATHAYLERKLGFHQLNKYDWSKFDSGVAGYSIPNSKAVHEFLSDVASLSTSEAFLGHMLPQYELGKDQAHMSGYHYSRAFLREKLGEIYARKGLDLQADLEKLSIFNLESKTKEILSHLTPEDRQELQKAFLDQGKKLVAQIQTKEVQKAGNYTLQEYITKFLPNAQ